MADEPSSVSTSLLVRVKLQQPEAWEQLATLYGPLVYHWCLQTQIQQADAEDVLQEVFRTVAAKVGEFRRETEDDTFRGWLWSITRNKIGDQLRRLGRSPNALGGMEGEEQLKRLQAKKEPSSFQLGTFFRDLLDSVRGEFREQTWDVFWSVVLEGQNPAVVADRYGMTVNAVYLAKSRVLRRLRQEAGGSHED